MGRLASQLGNVGKTSSGTSNAGVLEQAAHFRSQQVAVEIAHQNQAFFVGQQFGKIGDLDAARFRAQGQMGDRDMPGELRLRRTGPTARRGRECGSAA